MRASSARNVVAQRIADRSPPAPSPPKRSPISQDSCSRDGRPPKLCTRQPFAGSFVRMMGSRRCSRLCTPTTGNACALGPLGRSVSAPGRMRLQQRFSLHSSPLRDSPLNIPPVEPAGLGADQELEVIEGFCDFPVLPVPHGHGVGIPERIATVKFACSLPGVQRACVVFDQKQAPPL